MQITDYTQDRVTVPLLQMQQEMSLATDPDGVLSAFLRHAGAATPLRYLLKLNVDGLDAGSYHIADRYRVLGGEDEAPTPVCVSNPSELANGDIHKGGLLGEIVSTPGPKIVRELCLKADPVLQDQLAAFRSAVAVPVYDGGRITAWLIGFMPGADDADLVDLRMAMPSANLLHRSANYLELLQEVRTLNTRLQSQLEAVARVQQSLLPSQTPIIPGLKLATSYLTSDDAGGDYYDFFHLADGRWAIAIADVSGHGAAAATVMAMLHAILHGYEGRNHSPDAILAYTNRRLVHALTESTFVTAFLALYDPVDGTLTYARAGHNPPLHKDGRTGNTSELHGEGAPPLGLFDDFEAEPTTLRLQPGDTIVCYTDGITEAFNAQREMFGTEGLNQALLECTGEPDCVVESVHAALYRHTGARRRDDDQTLVAFRYLGRT